MVGVFPEIHHQNMLAVIGIPLAADILDLDSLAFQGKFDWNQGSVPHETGCDINLFHR